MHRAAAGALTGLLLLSGCRVEFPIRLPGTRNEPPSQQPTPTQDPQRDLIHRTLVTKLAAAMKKGDAAEVRPLLHPDVAEPEQRDIFDPISGAHAFELARLTMTTEPDVIPIRGDNAFIDVRGGYTVRGLPNRYEFRAKMSVKKSSGAWRIHGMNWTHAPPWVVPGPFMRTTGAASVVLAKGSFPAGELSLLVDEARGRLRASAPKPEERHLVAVPADAEGFRRVGGGSGIAVVITFYEWNGKEFVISFPFLLVNSEEYTEASTDERRTIVLHEMTHAALAHETMPFVPAWLTEGLAMYYSGDLPITVFEEDTTRLDRVSLPDLTRALELGAHGTLRERTTVEYAFSSAAAAYLTERFGEAAVIDFLLSYKTAFTVAEIEKRIPVFGTGGLASRFTIRDLGVEATERLLQKKFQLSSEQLDAAVKDWIRDRLLDRQRVGR